MAQSASHWFYHILSVKYPSLTSIKSHLNLLITVLIPKQETVAIHVHIADLIACFWQTPVQSGRTALLPSKHLWQSALQKTRLAQYPSKHVHTVCSSWHIGPSPLGGRKTCPDPGHEDRKHLHSATQGRGAHMPCSTNDDHPASSDSPST